MPKVVVLTEGPADDLFMRKLKEVRGLNYEIRTAVYPESYGNTGFEPRLRGLKLEISKTSVDDYAAIVIVSDNDDDPHGNFGKVRKWIVEAEDYIAPDQPFQLSARGPMPPVAVVMLPAANQSGSLDTMCLASLNPEYSKHLECAEGFAVCNSLTEELLGVIQFAKLKVQCLLSSICYGDPYTPLKCAWEVNANKKRPGDIFPLNHAVFDPVVQFFQSLPD